MWRNEMDITCSFMIILCISADLKVKCSQVYCSLYYFREEKMEIGKNIIG